MPMKFATAATRVQPRSMSQSAIARPISSGASSRRKCHPATETITPASYGLARLVMASLTSSSAV